MMMMIVLLYTLGLHYTFSLRAEVVDRWIRRVCIVIRTLWSVVWRVIVWWCSYKDLVSPGLAVVPC